MRNKGTIIFYFKNKTLLYYIIPHTFFCQKLPEDVLHQNKGINQERKIQGSQKIQERGKEKTKMMVKEILMTTMGEMQRATYSKSE